MAITILQQPASPNVTGTDLIYTLSSSIADAPQFRYVVDIYGTEGALANQALSGSLLSRTKYYPNTTGNTNIDLSREFNDYIYYDLYQQVTGSVAPTNTVRTYSVKFGEEYGTSVSSSRTIYPGTTDNFITVWPGNVYKNEGSFNFDSGSFIEAGSGNYFTNQPSIYKFTQSDRRPGPNVPLIASDAYYTVTRENWWTGGTGPTSVTVRGLYMSNGATSLVTSSVYTFPSTSGSFDTIGIGPANLSAQDSGWANYFASGSINYIITAEDSLPINLLINDLWDGVLPPSNPPFVDWGGSPRKQCSDEHTHFAFINVYGFWDYYTVFNPLRRTSQVGRSFYERPFVRYEDSQAIYNKADRGSTQYRTTYDDVYEITTDYIDQEMSQWLTELFESPDVRIQKNGEFIPVNIVNTTVDWNMNQYRQKLFQYTIQFKYSNDRITR